MKKLQVQDLDVKGKKVLLRVDFNVPLSKEGKITDDSRIRCSLPTIEFILEHGGSIILMSHLGRPKGIDPKFSLSCAAKRLSELLHRPVAMAPDCVGLSVEKMASQLREGQILMLENLRFHEGEENSEKDPDFVKKLALLADVYVNDAFATSHRAHASTALIAKYFPKKSAAGFLMQEEISHLMALLKDPKRPFYAVIGGAKISTKIKVVFQLLDLVDGLFLGGAMAFTFLKAKGKNIGSSLFEESEIKSVEEVLKKGQKKIHLPTDFIVANGFANDARKKVATVSEGIEQGWQGMDIGPNTIQEWSSLLQKAKTVFWNGPLGVFEMPNFAKGTFAIAQVLAHSSAEVVIGGGDSVAAIHEMHLQDQFAFLSTGGGASLEFLENKGHLPGIDALSEGV